MEYYSMSLLGIGSSHLVCLFCLMSESLSGKREGFQDNAIHKKGSLLLTRVRAFCRNQRSGAGSEKP